jgi:hypothetical protein
MAELISQRAIDPWYHEYVVDTSDQAFIDACIAETVADFRSHGYRTAIITEAQQERFLVSCIAVTDKGQNNQAVSAQAEAKIQDTHAITPLRQASVEPTLVSFDFKKKR